MILLAQWIGTLPGWLTVAAAIGAGYVLWKGGGGTALATLQVANQVLERRVHELTTANTELTAQVAELRGKTDMALAVRPFMEWAQTHEDRAAERHKATVTVLELLAERLGADA